MWNRSLKVKNELPRTNNDLEGWHNRFDASFQQRHAHIWKFIEGLQHDSTLNHHSITQIMAGTVVSLRRTYHAIIECIHLLVNNYANNNIIDFHKSIKET